MRLSLCSTLYPASDQNSSHVINVAVSGSSSAFHGGVMKKATSGEVIRLEVDNESPEGHDDRVQSDVRLARSTAVTFPLKNPMLLNL